MQECTRIVLYAMPDKNNPDGHPFIVMRGSHRNKKGKYVLGDEFGKFGLFWPNQPFKDRNSLAEGLGTAILNQLGI